MNTVNHTNTLFWNIIIQNSVQHIMINHAINSYDTAVKMIDIILNVYFYLETYAIHSGIVIVMNSPKENHSCPDIINVDLIYIHQI